MKTKRRVVALLTDFGLIDHYVGVMKGVILSRAPHVTIVDISHQVSPQNVHEAAFLLWSAYRFFPEGTIFVAVVDPGVGSERNILCVKAHGYFFLSPDNGLLKYVLAELKKPQIFSVTNKNLYLPEVSSTFHGRDIFAPAAAHLANGLSLSKLGETVKPETRPENFLTLDLQKQKQVKGAIIYIDRFGNLVTNIRLEKLSRVNELRQCRMQISNTSTRNRPKKTVHYFSPTYTAAPTQTPFMIVGSSGLLEISIKNRGAAKALGARVGTPVTLKIVHA